MATKSKNTKKKPVKKAPSKKTVKKAAPKKTAKKAAPKKAAKPVVSKPTNKPKRKGAPVGNQFWKLRSKHGRDRLFETPEILWEAACEYFEWCEANPFKEEDFVSGGPMAGTKVLLNKMRPFLIEGLCTYLDCNKLYFNDFERSLVGKEDKLSKDFSMIITRIKEIIYTQKFSGAASGFFNANIIARDLGLSDKTESKNQNTNTNYNAELTNDEIKQIGKALEDEC